MTRMLLVLVSLIMTTIVATAGMQPGPTYEEAIHSMAQKLQAVGGANNLSEEQQVRVERTVLTWFALGPCERPSPLSGNAAVSAVQAVSDSANFWPRQSDGKWSTPPIMRAITEMVSVLLIMNNSLGRIEKDGYLCRYAASRLK